METFKNYSNEIIGEDANYLWFIILKINQTGNIKMAELIASQFVYCLR